MNPNIRRLLFRWWAIGFGIICLFPAFSSSLPEAVVTGLFLTGLAGFIFYRDLWYSIRTAKVNSILLAVCLTAFLVHSLFFCTPEDALLILCYALAIVGWFVLLMHHTPADKSPPPKKRRGQKTTAIQKLRQKVLRSWGLLILLTASLWLLGIYFLNRDEMYYTGNIALMGDALVVSKFDFILFFTLAAFYLSSKLYELFLTETFDAFAFALILGLYPVAFFGVWIFFNYVYVVLLVILVLIPCFRLYHAKGSQFSFSGFLLIKVGLILLAFLLALIDQPTRKKYAVWLPPLHAVSLKFQYAEIIPGRMNQLGLEVVNTGLADIGDTVTVFINFSDILFDDVQVSEMMPLEIPVISSGESTQINITVNIPYWLQNYPGITVRMYKEGLGFLDQFDRPGSYYPLNVKQYNYEQDFNLSKLNEIYLQNIQSTPETFVRNIKPLDKHFTLPFNRIASVPVWGSGFFDRELKDQINVNNYMALISRTGVYFGSFILLTVAFLIWKLIALTQAHERISIHLWKYAVGFIFFLGLKYNIPIKPEGALFLMVIFSFIYPLKRPDPLPRSSV